jgi:Domain of unknown function (DUF4129)
VPAITRRQRAGVVALLPSAVVLGLLLVVWAASTGPVGVFSDSGRRYVFHSPAFTPRTASASGNAGTLKEITAHSRSGIDLSWVGDLLITALYVGLGLVLFLVARNAWRRRWRAPEKPPETEFEVLPDAVVVQRLAADRDRQLAVVEEGAPRNGIVACWVLFEESLSEVGLRPHPAETSAELVTRVLHALDLDPRSISTLAGLYREARFSEHTMGEDARDAARSTLNRLHDELRALGGVR